LKAINTDIPIRRFLVGRTAFLKDENFSFFKDTKNGPRIIKLIHLIIATTGNINQKLPLSSA